MPCHIAIHDSSLLQTSMGTFSLEKKILRKDIIAAFKYRRGGVWGCSKGQNQNQPCKLYGRQFEVNMNKKYVKIRTLF